MNPAWNDARRFVRQVSRSRFNSDEVEHLISKDDLESPASHNLSAAGRSKTLGAREFVKPSKTPNEFLTRSASAAISTGNGTRRISDPSTARNYGAVETKEKEKDQTAESKENGNQKTVETNGNTNATLFSSISRGLHDIDSDYSAEDNSPATAKSVESPGEEAAPLTRSESILPGPEWLPADLAVVLMWLTGNYFLSSFLIFIPLGFAAYILSWTPGLIFTFNFLAIIPLAWLLGNSTEELALRTNPTLGGLLNATFGNAVELIVSVIALRKGLIKLVQTSLLGSILSNMLLVLGMSFFLGGLKYRHQSFNRKGAQIFSSMLLLACLAICIPSAYVSSFSPTPSLDSVLHISRMTAVLVFSAYLSYLFFQLKTHQDMFDAMEDDDEQEESSMSLAFAVGLLVAVTVCVAFCSEFLVDAIEPITREWDINESFVGIILIPIVGNAAEHATAVTVAMKNKLDLSIGVAIGSSTQISLFLIPFITLLGWALDQPMTLNFSMFETVVLVLSVLIVNFIVKDGESNWLVGLMLMTSYFIIGTAYYFHPNEPESPVNVHN